MNSRVKWDIKEGIGIISICNPPENYLYEPEFVRLETLREWTGEPTLKGILIRGEGKHFSAGGDLKRLFEMISAHEDLMEKLRTGHAVIDHLIGTNLPLVAAIQGVCFGGGLELALACHIRVASQNSIFASPETIHGLIPGMGGTVRLPATVGKSNALKMILSGEMISTDEAYRMKLIDFIVPGTEVFSFAFSLLRRMVKNLDPRIINAVMKTLQNSLILSPDKAIAEETKIFFELAQAEHSRRLSEPEI